jgi:hypothetical protein
MLLESKVIEQKVPLTANNQGPVKSSKEKFLLTLSFHIHSISFTKVEKENGATSSRSRSLQDEVAHICQEPIGFAAEACTNFFFCFAAEACTDLSSQLTRRLPNNKEFKRIEGVSNEPSAPHLRC